MTGGFAATGGCAGGVAIGGCAVSGCFGGFATGGCTTTGVVGVVSTGFVGALGVSGTSLALFVAGDLASLAVLYGACAALEIRVRTYLRETVLRTSVPLVLLAGTYLGLRFVAPPLTYATMAVHATVALVVYGAAAWRFTLTSSERERLRAWISSRRARSRKVA